MRAERGRPFSSRSSRISTRAGGCGAFTWRDTRPTSRPERSSAVATSSWGRRASPKSTSAVHGGLVRRAAGSPSRVTTSEAAGSDGKTSTTTGWTPTRSPIRSDENAIAPASSMRTTSLIPEQRVDRAVDVEDGADVLEVDVQPVVVVRARLQAELPDFEKDGVAGPLVRQQPPVFLHEIRGRVVRHRGVEPEVPAEIHAAGEAELVGVEGLGGRRDDRPA